MTHFKDQRGGSGNLLRANHAEPGGRLMIFGRPTLAWEGAPSPEDYFAELYGVDEVHTLDVSAYEGATFIHDLNAPDMPDEWKGRYRAVSMGGSAQFVFCINHLLRKAAELLEVGGLVFCQAPSNNRQENAYFQLCPTLKFDFFEANGFELGTSMATLDPLGSTGFRRYVPVYPGEVRSLNFIPAQISHILVAKKLATSTSDKIPINSTYRFRHNGERVRWRFRAIAPYDVHHGKRITAPMRRFAVDTVRLRLIEQCYAFPFSESDLPPSVPIRPFRSRVLVYENGELLDWIVSDRSMVREQPGSFGHFGAYVYFNSSDGSDPRKNGRTYDILVPQLFTGVEPYAKDPLYNFEFQAPLRPSTPRTPTL